LLKCCGCRALWLVGLASILQRAAVFRLDSGSCYCLGRGLARNPLGRTPKTARSWLSGQQDRGPVARIVGVPTRIPLITAGLLAFVHHSGTFLV